ncbi:cupredoxin domain-containing protein [Rhodopirellula europaea]|nr:hypothetical protein [Rhodopirellula europaea]
MKRLRLTVCFLAAIGLILALPSDGRADLYAEGAASLEWKVDAADEIYLAEIVEDGKSRYGLRFEPLETLKAGRELSTFPHESVHHCILGRALRYRPRDEKLGTRWLLFVRGNGDQARVADVINLTHPTASWGGAAISGFGKGNARVLRDPQVIIERVKERIRLAKPLPVDCIPDLTDQLYAKRTQHIPLAAWFGGKLLDTNIMLWDEKNEFGEDHDTVVTPLLVPLDVPLGSAYKELSLETLPDTYHFNFMFDGATGDFVRRGNPLDNKSELIGTWRSESDDRILTITFYHRLTCLYRIELKPGASDPRLESFGGVCFGAGRWHVHRGYLRLGSISQIDYRFGKYPEWSFVYEPKLPSSRVVEVNKDRIRLADGKVFSRMNEPLRVHDHPHIHPFYMISEGWGLHRVRSRIHATIVLDDEVEPVPLSDLVLLWKKRGSPPIQGPPRPTKPRTVRTKLGDNGFEPRITVLRAGDTLEIEAAGSRPVVDHNINVEWFRNEVRGFRSRLDLPLIYQRKVSRDEPALMPIQCNIHDDEHGYLAVTDHGNVAVTDEDGYATLSQWPIGRQKLVVIHPDYDFGDAEIWANGEKVENSKSAIWLDLTNDNIELRIEGAEHRE